MVRLVLADWQPKQPPLTGWSRKHLRMHNTSRVKVEELQQQESISGYIPVSQEQSKNLSVEWAHDYQNWTDEDGNNVWSYTPPPR